LHLWFPREGLILVKERKPLLIVLFYLSLDFTNEELNELACMNSITFRLVPWTLWISGLILIAIGIVVLYILYLATIKDPNGSMYPLSLRFRPLWKYLVLVGFVIAGIILLFTKNYVNVTFDKTSNTVTKQSTNILCKTTREVRYINEINSLKIEKRGKSTAHHDTLRYKVLVYISTNRFHNQTKINIKTTGNLLKARLEVT